MKWPGFGFNRVKWPGFVFKLRQISGAGYTGSYYLFGNWIHKTGCNPPVGVLQSSGAGRVWGRGRRGGGRGHGGRHRGQSGNKVASPHQVLVFIDALFCTRVPADQGCRPTQVFWTRILLHFSYCGIRILQSLKNYFNFYLILIIILVKGFTETFPSWLKSEAEI